MPPSDPILSRARAGVEATKDPGANLGGNMSASGERVSELNNRVFVFTGATLEAALRDWVAEQIEAYPQREALIRTTALAMRAFLESEQVRRHKMTLANHSDG